jgi:large subunit ribosomal protein L17
MRHGKKFNHLGRKSAHRKAMLANMAASLILNKRVQTTTAKAKALRTFIEPLITKAKDDRTHSRRIVFKYLQNKEAVSELFRDVAEKVSDRPGGYTRILKTGNRLGDNAEMCFIELVDYNENYSTSAEGKTKSKRRRRRGSSGSGKKSTEAQTESTAKDTAVAEEDTAQEQAAAEVKEEKQTEPTTEKKQKTAKTKEESKAQEEGKEEKEKKEEEPKDEDENKDDK